MTEPRLDLGVYRRLDNRLQGLDDQSEFAWELHRRRLAALQDAFDPASGVEVIDWGLEAKDETRTHEFAELVVLVDLAVQHVLVPGARLLGEKLMDLGVDAVLVAATKAVWSKLRPKQQAKEILDFRVTLPGGTVVESDAPEQGSTVRISTPDGFVEISHQAQTAAR